MLKTAVLILAMIFSLTSCEEVKTEVIENSEVEIGAYIAYTPSCTSYIVTTNESGYTSDQEFNPSTTTSWRVMYNNAGQLDIVSADSVQTTSDANLYLRGSTGYAQAVDTLNNLGNAYVNSTYATSGRHIGSTSSSVGTIDTTTYPLTYGVSGSPYTDTYYSTDVIQLTDNDLLHSSGITWLASRYLRTNVSRSLFGVRELLADDGINEYYLYYTGRGGGTLSDDYAHGVRPVVSLDSGIRIVSGSGTSSDPYVISK